MSGPNTKSEMLASCSGCDRAVPWFYAEGLLEVLQYRNWPLKIDDSMLLSDAVS